MTQEQIEQFVEQNDLSEDAHFKVIVEEFGEFADACSKGDRIKQREELADFAITVRVMAELLGIDLEEAVEEKMEYNLQKSGEKTEGGKVKDDV